MKALGIVRSTDDLGRIVIPKELRRSLNIEEKDALEIFTDDNGCIILKKYNPGCEHCNSLDDLKEVKGHRYCGNCRKEIGRA